MFVALGLLAATATAGTAPSGEQQLRARVDQLYSALRRSDWRQVEKYLTKESIPVYRNLPKKPVTGYQIESVKLEASGESAAVIVGLPAPPGLIPAQPILIPQTTHWRRVKGHWCLDLTSPQAALGPSNPAAQLQTPPPSLHPKDLKFQSTWASVGIVHKGEVKVARFAITNVSQRVVSLADVQTDCACLRMKSQQKEFKPGEAGVLEFELDPSSLNFDARTALTLTVAVVTEPEHARTQLTIGAVLVPGSGQPPAP